MPDPKVLAIAPFSKWTYEDAQKAMRDILPQDYDVKRKYVVDGDHYQKGTQWVGPGDATGNEKIEKQFAPEDAIGAVLTNIENAFSEPQLGTRPQTETPELKALGAEVVGLLGQWWDRQRLQEHLHDRIRTSAWAGWAGLRLWIPWRFLLVQPDGTITIRPATDVKEALSFIHVMAPEPKNSAIIRDGGTQDAVAVFLDTEVEYIDKPNGETEKKEYPRAELMYLDPERTTDEDADTIIRVVYANNDKVAKTIRMTLGGRLMYGEMRTRVVINDAVLRTQRQLNLVTTLVTRLAETAAFRERYTKNAKPQGIRIPYEDGDRLADGAFIERDIEGRQWAVVPQARTLGAATTTELVGLDKHNNTGDHIGQETPDVLVVDPVDPGPYILAGDNVRKRILRMCGQGHLGGGSNAEASGIAYEQARAVFEKDLQKRRVTEEGMLREVLTTVLTLAEILAGEEGKYTESLDLTVDQHINAGPRSPDLVRLDLEAYEGGVVSEETTMAKLGIEDTEAEKARLHKSAGYILSVLEKAAAASNFLEGESLLAVLTDLGIPKEIVDKLVAAAPETDSQDNQLVDNDGLPKEEPEDQG